MSPAYKIHLSNMSPYKTPLSLAVMFAVTTCLPQRIHAQNWTNGQAASFVIGQTGFGLNASSVTATGLSQPWGGVVIDPATGKVFVSDLSNNRILRYPSAAAMTNGAAAEAVLGQPNFTQNSNSLSATTLWQPAGMAMDAAGNLWVADERNNRVLRNANAATIASGSAASSVLGQPNLTTDNYPLVTASSMYEPYSVFCSGTTLWVGDTGSDRVLRFENAASLANGAAASAVFGQPDFTTNTAYDPPNAFSLYAPMQIYVDGADNLWVVDFVVNRVVMFPNAATAANYEAATLVLGQPDFNSAAAGSTATTFNSLIGVYGDQEGNIYVSDYGNNRILIFANAASLSNGAAATYVLGQTNFTSTGTGDNANQLNGPTFLFVGTSLLAADATNNRVLVYIPLIPLPLSITSFTGHLQGNGQVLLQWQIADQGEPAGATAELQYSTRDTSGFTTVLSTQPVNPAVSGYSYVQVSPAPGANYYRVKLTAPDGSATYSQIVTINVGGGATGTGLSIYPNPASSNVVMMLPPLGNAVIEVYNSAGGLMRRLATASTFNTLDVSSLAAGMYTVRVTQGVASTIGTFIKVNE
jgi:hypothetical protein